MKQTLAITRKELSSYFGSPLALIFVGVFLAAALVAVFWVDAFFARGIADVRPLFQWMPILMIFLVAALTMRQWSEEQRSGTLEMLLTLPVSNIQLVIGKFLAVMALVALSLLLTLFLPITVSMMGNLDWGPVIGGYVAALLLASAYTAIGLWISSRTDNQIVALILTALVCGLFYAVGSSSLTGLVGNTPADILRAIGAGSRFESIERGVIDLRDLLYYLTLAGVFLVLNVISLDVKRWSQGERTLAYRRAMTVTAVLLEVNLIAMNVWLYPLNGLRLDLTQQHEYTLSQTTKDILGNLQEPLLIRGYFSEKTHPLLSPLVPQMRDLMQEYQIAGRGKVTVDIVDPSKDPAKEQEANQTYGIQPTPLQVSGRYEASVINAYFDILVRYGNQNVTLNFRDLIATATQPDGTTSVTLRNPEYDLTRAIKKVVSGFQSVDSVLAAMNSPVKLTLFVTPDTLPDALKTAPATIQKVAQDLQTKSNGKLTFEQINPDDPNAKVNRQALIQTYHLQPIAASLFSSDSYYLDMVLQVGDKSQVLSLDGDPTAANVQTTIESGLKRSTSGFLKVVGLWMPPQTPTTDAVGQQQQPLATFQQAQQQLQAQYTVQQVDLSTGQVPSNIDTLVLIAPQGMDDKAKYAIDQYLMRGGSVVVAAGSYMLTPPNQMMGTWLGVQPIQGGIADMLESYGIKIENSLVMDPQNEPFPVQVQRNVNGATVPEYQLIPYPFSVDVRPENMDRSNPIVSNLPMVTLNWASPLTVDPVKNQGRQVSVLAKSSKNSWARTTPSIEPNFQQQDLGFTPEGTVGSQTLAVAVTGSFQSFFKGKPSPLAPTAPVTNTAQSQQQAQPTPAPVTGSSIDVSLSTSRLVVIGSNDFLDDVVFQISASSSQDRYLNSLQFLQNAVDWSVEDLDLLSIRSRGTSARVLAPMAQARESFWEGLNYALALLSLVVIGVFWTLRKRNERPMDLDAPQPDAMNRAHSQA